MSGFLDNLDVGDKIAVVYVNGSSERYEISKIIKKTPTGKLRVGCDPNYLFTNGSYKISDWDWITLEPITQEITDKLERNKLLRKIKYSDFSKLSLTQLKKIVNIMEAKG